MPWTYIVRCNDGSFYTGSTNGDLEARVWEHNNDPYYSAVYTRERRPVVLVHAEQFDAVDTAFHREKQIQGWSRAKKLALIEGRMDDLPAMSRSHGGDASTSSATQVRGSETRSTGSGGQYRRPSTGSGGQDRRPSTGSGT